MHDLTRKWAFMAFMTDFIWHWISSRRRIATGASLLANGGILMYALFLSSYLETFFDP